MTTFDYHVVAESGACRSGVVRSSSLTLTATSTVFNHTGAVATFVVPAGVTRMGVVAWGASGGCWTGGRGARITTEMDVTPGETLEIRVAGTGKSGTQQAGDVSHCVATIGAQNGFNGGGAALAHPRSVGGGGATDVRRGGSALTDRVVVAAGGGGASVWGVGGDSNNTGDLRGHGGQGQGAGLGASISAAGNGAAGGNAGTFGAGGASVVSGSFHSAGGGGGYFGGGSGFPSGSGSFWGGAGGGGSSFIAVTSNPTVINAESGNMGDGRLTLTY